MAKVRKWEEKVRKVLKEYNNDNIELDWIVDILVRGYRNERDSSQTMLKELNFQSDRFKLIHAQFQKIEGTSPELKRLEYMIKLYGDII